MSKKPLILKIGKKLLDSIIPTILATVFASIILGYLFGSFPPENRPYLKVAASQNDGNLTIYITNDAEKTSATGVEISYWILDVENEMERYCSINPIPMVCPERGPVEIGPIPPKVTKAKVIPLIKHKEKTLDECESIINGSSDVPPLPCDLVITHNLREFWGEKEKRTSIPIIIQVRSNELKPMKEPVEIKSTLDYKCEYGKNITKCWKKEIFYW